MKNPWIEWVLALAWVAGASMVGLLARRWFNETDQAMVHLVAVVGAAAYLGRGPALLAAFVSVAAYGFLFVSPYYTFAVDEPRFLFTFGVMLAVGVIVAELTRRVRHAAAEAERARSTADAERQRSELLSAVSHDLRTPLASITAGATALLAQPGTDEQREIQHAIREEGERMGRLVANLLDLTRLQSGTLRARRELTPVEDVIAAAVGRLQPLLADRTVTIDVPEEVLQAPMDATLVEQVLTNLLENACKYSPARSPIAVAARVEGRRVRIEVSDRGPGIPAGEAERLFERFYRSADGQRAGGVGLGLAICRAIVNAHGGAIEAAAREGGGATFRLWLPLDVPAVSP